jgi:hypothetical protein
MKRICTLISSLVLLANTASALIVNVDDYGEVPAEGLEITLTEAEEDPLTGLKLMELQGNLLCTVPLQVTIVRSDAEVTDEFCCAGQCISGNKQPSQTLEYTPDGIATWFTHYTPVEGKNVTIVYTFTDADESRTLTVHYNYGSQAIEYVFGQPDATVVYSLTGAALGHDVSDLPAGTYIHSGTTIIKIQ